MKTSNRVRKPTPTAAQGGYFGDNEEQAVAEYLATQDLDERRRIYDEKLAKPFATLVESIIRRYNLYLPDETFKETFTDTMAFLLMQLNKFTPSKGHKAYSYYGTICKNHLIGRINKAKEGLATNMSYDESCSEINDDIRFSYTMDEQAEDLDRLIERLMDGIRSLLSPEKVHELTPNEQKVGQALLNFLSNWEDIFEQMGSNKFNKSTVQTFLKETTLLPLKDIKEAMKKFKSLYFMLKLNDE